MNGIPSPIDDERISAYLDGELKAEERAEFEQLLHDRSDYRDAVGELEVVRDTVRELPQESLPDDFYKRVLRRAETVMLTTSSVETVRSLEVESPVPTSRNLRRWIWPLAAIAAALLIMLIQPQLVQPPDIVQKPASVAGEVSGDASIADGELVDSLESLSGVASDDRESSVDEMIRAEPRSMESRSAPMPPSSRSVGVPILAKDLAQESRRKSIRFESTEEMAQSTDESGRALTEMSLGSLERRNSDRWSHSLVLNEQLDAVAKVTASGLESIEGFRFACEQNNISCQPSAGSLNDTTGAIAIADGKKDAVVADAFSADVVEAEVDRADASSLLGVEIDAGDLSAAPSVSQLVVDLAEDLKVQDMAVRQTSRPPDAQPEQQFQSFLVEADATRMEQLVTDLRRQQLDVKLVANMSRQATEVNRLFGFQPSSAPQLQASAGQPEEVSRQSGNYRYPIQRSLEKRSPESESIELGDRKRELSRGVERENLPNSGLLADEEAAATEDDALEVSPEGVPSVGEHWLLYDSAEDSAPLRVLFFFPIDENRSGKGKD